MKGLIKMLDTKYNHVEEEKELGLKNQFEINNLCKVNLFL